MSREKEVYHSPLSSAKLRIRRRKSLSLYLAKPSSRRGKFPLSLLGQAGRGGGKFLSLNSVKPSGRRGKSLSLSSAKPSRRRETSSLSTRPSRVGGEESSSPSTRISRVGGGKFLFSLLD